MSVETDGGDEQADAEADDDGTQQDRQIERCENCGRVFVNWHRCRDELTEGGSVTSDERERLSTLDDGDPTDTVLYLPGRGDSAYHVLDLGRDDEGRFESRPACEAKVAKPTGSNGKPRTWQRTTRGEARDRSPRFPCRECHDLDGRDE